MDKRVSRIAKDLGAKHVGTLPNVGGGAFGMARFAQLLHARLAPRRWKAARPPHE